MKASSLQKNTGLMALGAFGGQGVALLSILFLSRLYSPEQFGLFASIVAFATLLSPIVTARYELALVPAKTERDASHLLVGVCIVAFVSTCLASLILIGLQAYFSDNEFFVAAGKLIWFIPLIGLASALGQVGLSSATRAKRFGRISMATLAQPLSFSTVAVALGAIGFGPFGLLLGRLTGMLAFFSLVGSSVLKLWRNEIGLPTLQQMLDQLRSNWQYPAFNLPLTLMNGFTRDVLTLLFTAFAQLGAAGFYGLARMALLAPVTLVSASLSQIFFKEAADRLGEDAFRQQTHAMMTGIGLAFAGGCGFLFLRAPDLFAILFGEQWRTSGLYASYLAIPIALFGIVAWPVRIFEVTGKQSWTLALHIIFDGFGALLLFGLLAWGYPSLDVVISAAALQCLFFASQLALIFFLLDLNLLDYLSILAKVAVAFGAVYLVSMLAGWGFDNLWFAVGAEFVVMACCGLLGLRLVFNAMKERA